nr:hypothetical protein [uncultured Duganella sp.]
MSSNSPFSNGDRSAELAVRITEWPNFRGLPAEGEEAETGEEKGPVGLCLGKLGLPCEVLLPCYPLNPKFFGQHVRISLALELS